MAKGAGWTVSANFALRTIGFISTIILARLLVPEDFGLVAMATLLMAGLEVFGEFGPATVLIRFQKANHHHYNTVWTLTVVRGAVLAALLSGLAAPAAIFFNEARLEAIIYFLALIAVLQGCNNVGVIDFQKEMQFHKEFALNLGGRIVAFVVTIGCALVWRNYWALVAGIMTRSFAHLALSYIMHPYRPRFSLVAWRDVIGFAKWMLATNLLKFWFSQSNPIILGKLIGVQSVGLYSIAFEIANLVTSELLAPIRRSILPGYAKLANHAQLLRKSFIDVFSLVLLIGVPLTAGVGLIAEPLVFTILGDKWIGCVPLIQVLAIYGLFNVIRACNGPIYLALGVPSRLTFLYALGIIVMIPVLILAVTYWDTLGAAWAITVAAAVVLCVDFYMIMQLLDLPGRSLIQAGWRSITAATGMILVVNALMNTFGRTNTWGEAAFLLGISIMVGGITYTCIHLGLWRISGWPDESAERQVLFALRKGFTALSGTVNLSGVR